MRKTFYFTLGMLALAALLQPGRAQDKAATGSTLKVKVRYNGSGTVDDKHKILVFLFDTPAFAQGTAIPFATQSAASKKENVTFTDVSKSPVYVAIVFDPTGKYEGMSPPPSGSFLGMYSTTPGTPAPVKMKEGKVTQIEVQFDDTQKIP